MQNKKDIISKEKEIIEKEKNKEKIVYGIKNGGSFAVFFIATATALSTMIVSIPTAIIAATVSYLSYLYNFKETKKHYSKENKYNRLLKRLDKLKYEQEIKGYSAIEKARYKNIENEVLLKNVEVDFQTEIIENLVVSGIAIVGGVLTFVNPLSIILEAAALSAAYMVTKAEIRYSKKKDIAEYNLKDIEYQLKLVEKNKQEEKKKSREVPCNEYNYGKINEKNKVYVKVK